MPPRSAMKETRFAPLPDPRELSSTKKVDHASLSWTACYDDNCLAHKDSKDGSGWYPKKPAGGKTIAAMSRSDKTSLDGGAIEYPVTEKASGDRREANQDSMIFTYVDDQISIPREIAATFGYNSDNDPLDYIDELHDLCNDSDSEARPEREGEEPSVRESEQEAPTLQEIVDLLSQIQYNQEMQGLDLDSMQVTLANLRERWGSTGHKQPLETILEEGKDIPEPVRRIEVRLDGIEMAIRTLADAQSYVAHRIPEDDRRDLVETIHEQARVIRESRAELRERAQIAQGIVEQIDQKLEEPAMKASCRVCDEKNREIKELRRRIEKIQEKPRRRVQEILRTLDKEPTERAPGSKTGAQAIDDIPVRTKVDSEPEPGPGATRSDEGSDSGKSFHTKSDHSYDDEGNEKLINPDRYLQPETYNEERRQRHKKRGGKKKNKGKSLAATTRTEEDHLMVKIRLNGHEVEAMVDSGAMGTYISPGTVNRWELPYQKKEHPYHLTSIDGTPINYDQGLVHRETAQLEMTIGERTESVQFDITNTGRHEIVLGRPWLKKSNPRIDWATDQLYWNNERQH